MVENLEYQAVVQGMQVKMHAGWKAALPAGIKNYSNNKTAPDFLPWGKEAMFGPYAKQKSK